jgi:hypothetical protein
VQYSNKESRKLLFTEDEIEANVLEEVTISQE